jgi:hypothetical protein
MAKITEVELDEKKQELVIEMKSTKYRLGYVKITYEKNR